jgi:hypothetical protein
MERMSKMIEALKARAEKAHRKPLTPEEIRERLHNSEFFKRLKEAQEKKLNALNKKEE